MSWEVASIVRKKKVGSSSRKSVLLAMASCANHDGSAVYMSKSRIAAETELSRQTVVTVIQEFEREGIAVAVGKKLCTTGYTVVYHLSLSKIQALQDAWTTPSNLDTLDQALVDGDAEEKLAGFEVSNHATLPVIEVSNPPPRGVKPLDITSPSITKDKDFPKSEVKRTSSIALWEANRCRINDPERFKELQEEAERLLEAELAAERQPPKPKKERKHVRAG